jgi:hypothetical protein
LTPQNEIRLEQLVAALEAAWGIEVSHSDVVQAALVELQKKFPPLEGGAAQARKKRGNK